jgi:two-component system OmpR family sensor kinase/two-component system sensor histidine kinase QseC
MRSLRTRLLLSLLVMLAVAAAAIGWITYRQVLAETQSLFDYQLRQMALSLRDQGEIAPDQAGALADEQLDFVVQIWSADGRSIYASRVHPELPARALLGFADIAVGKRTWRTFSVAARDRVIQVAQPVAIRQSLAANAALRTIAPLLWVAPLMLLMAGWLVTRALAPLRRVAAELRGRDARTLQPLAADGLPEEVGPLVNALNVLLGRLSEALGVQRAFVADAAHELRSPLTALKLQLDLLRRATDEPTRVEATRSLAGGIERAVRLVEQLLALARSDPDAPVAREPLDLAELARQAVADLVPLAAARGTELAVEAEQPLAMAGERAALAALVRNLVDNAIRYSPHGAHVALSVQREGTQAVLRVDDDGPGIPADERERVFDRFYRRDSGDADGSGLGLAIVRGVVQRHGGTVALDSSPAGGLRVVVRLPLGA